MKVNELWEIVRDRNEIVAKFGSIGFAILACKREKIKVQSPFEPAVIRRAQTISNFIWRYNNKEIESLTKHKQQKRKL